MAVQTQERGLRYNQLAIGDPAPLFTQRSSSNEAYHFDTAAGRYLVLCFFCSTGYEYGKKALAILDTHRGLFDDTKIAFFGISLDPADEQQKRVREKMPGIRYFWDADGKISRLYGVLPAEAPEAAQQLHARPAWVVLDPSLRVINYFPFTDDNQSTQAIARYLESLPPVSGHAQTPLHAPVLVLPRVFEPAFCRHLIDLYEKNGGEDSGFMCEEGQMTVAKLDHGHKKRKDFTFSEQPEYEGLRNDIQRRIMRRLVPEVKKAFQFQITRMERYVVACYDGETGGHFRPHRDNTTKGTAHRRFACTINLNAEDYEGGDLCFPEFGTQTYRAPTGGAVVFSCSLLHEAKPVTRGYRYAFLPFFYDEAGKKIRDENLKYLEST